LSAVYHALRGVLTLDAPVDSDRTRLLTVQGDRVELEVERRAKTANHSPYEYIELRIGIEGGAELVVQ
jgi:hypothetical protein